MKKGLGKYTTAHLKWPEFTRLISEMQQDGDYFWRGTLILGVFFSLRVSDLLSLRWTDVLEKGEIKSQIRVFERKTKKSKPTPRVITISEDGKKALLQLRKHYPHREYIISPHFRGQATSHWLNKHLKRKFQQYSVDYDGNVSSHLFRKTFGYRYAEVHNFSHESILYLNKIFRHSTLEYTLRYLGLESRAVAQAYHEVCVL